MKTVLHVGCGLADIRKMPSGFQEGWQEIRLDIVPGFKPDIVASITDMREVQSGSVDAVYSSHNIEHLYAHEVPLALAEFYRVLNSSGFLILSTPDLQPLGQLLLEGRLEDVLYTSTSGPIAPIDVIYGFRPAIAQGAVAMAHKTGFTARTLYRALLKAGFVQAIVNHGSHNLLAVAVRTAADFNGRDLLNRFGKTSRAIDRIVSDAAGH